MASVFVGLYANATMNIKAVFQGPACHGDATGMISLVMDGGVAPYTFEWSNGATTSTINNLTAGSYSVTVNDNVGAISVSTISIGEPFALDVTPLVIDASTAGGNNGGILLTVRGGTPDYSYAWSNGQTSKNVSQLTAGDYTVTITDGSGCQISSTSTVSDPGSHMIIGHNNQPDNRMLTTGVGEVKIPALSVYPNPANGFINLQFQNADKAEYVLINANGEEVTKHELANSSNAKIDVSALPAGNYLIKVKTTQGTVTKSVVVTK